MCSWEMMAFSSFRGSAMIAVPFGRRGTSPIRREPEATSVVELGLFAGPPPYTESRSKYGVRLLTSVEMSTLTLGSGVRSSVRS